MRVFGLSILAAAALSAFSSNAQAQQNPPDNLEHPGAVALSQDTDGSWVYKSFPSLMPLYVFEGDEELKSNCDHVCTRVWPIIRATPEDTTVGQWTAIERPGGERQWAYKGKPVYMFYNDEPGQPRGVGKTEGWYYEEEEDQLRPARPTDDKRAIWRLLEP